MTQKHTPGPWTVYAGNGYTIEQWDGDAKEDAANALLIAAAPDLLEACERCLSIFKQLADAGKYPEIMMAENGGEGFLFLSNAILKAKGGEK